MRASGATVRFVLELFLSPSPIFFRATLVARNIGRHEVTAIRAVMVWNTRQSKLPKPVPPYHTVSTPSEAPCMHIKAIFRCLYHVLAPAAETTTRRAGAP